MYEISLNFSFKYNISKFNYWTDRIGCLLTFRQLIWTSHWLDLDPLNGPQFWKIERAAIAITTTVLSKKNIYISLTWRTGHRPVGDISQPPSKWVWCVRCFNVMVCVVIDGQRWDPCLFVLLHLWWLQVLYYKQLNLIQCPAVRVANRCDGPWWKNQAGIDMITKWPMSGPTNI